MEFSTFKDTLFTVAKEKGFTDCELYYSSSKSFTVKVFKSEIAEYKNTESAGASFRGTIDGRVGYAYTERLDGSVIPRLVDSAASNASVIEETEVEKLYPGEAAYPEVSCFSKSLDEVSAERKIETALALEKYAYSLDPRVKSIDHCVLGTEDSETKISNTYGLDVSHRVNIAVGYIYARTEENGETKNGFEFWAGRDFNEFDYKALAESAVRGALESLGAKSVPSGEYAIMFTGEAVRDLFETFEGIFHAENAQKGFSLLSGKTGEQIASNIVTLRDDGICESAYICSPFDSEGVACKNKAVIENGVLKTLLYNTKSAEKDGVESTGNGMRGSFKSSVSTSSTNFYIVPSDRTPDELMEEACSGIIINNLAGMHSGANTVSGDFSLSASGFLIQDGKKGQPVEQITVAGNFYGLLKNISGVACDLRFGPPSQNGSVGMPSIMVSGLHISGL